MLLSSSGSLGMQRSGSNVGESSTLIMLKAETGLLMEGLDPLWNQDIHWGAREAPLASRRVVFLPEDGWPLNWLLHSSIRPGLIHPR